MALTELLFGIHPASISARGDLFGVLTLDACVREVHRASAKATRHPVEVASGSSDSSDVCDNAQVEPLTVAIDGVISNYPAEYMASLVYMGQDRAADAHLELLYKLVNRQICTIVTSLGTYDDMLLEMLEVPREAKTGNSLVFTAQATQITLVSLEGEIVGTKSTKSTGAAAAKPAGAAKAAAVKKTSAAFKALLK